MLSLCLMRDSNSNSNTIIFGKHPVMDALKSGRTIDKIVMQQGFKGPVEIEIRHLCKERRIPIQQLPKERIARMVDGNHQGMIAFLSSIEYQKLEDILPKIYEQSKVPFFLLLDGITDVRNFGGIARTAEAMGVQAIVIPRKKSAQINSDAIKASAGALLDIPVCKEASIVAAVEFLQNSGVQVYAGDLYAEKGIHHVDFTVPTAIIIGAEGRGVSPSILKMVNETFIIPQVGKTDSLNVSVATGIMMYEVLMQRLDKNGPKKSVPE